MTPWVALQKLASSAKQVEVWLSEPAPVAPCLWFVEVTRREPWASSIHGRELLCSAMAAACAQSEFVVGQTVRIIEFERGYWVKHDWSWLETLIGHQAPGHEDAHIPQALLIAAIGSALIIEKRPVRATLRNESA